MGNSLDFHLFLDIVVPVLEGRDRVESLSHVGNRVEKGRIKVTFFNPVASGSLELEDFLLRVDA